MWEYECNLYPEMCMNAYCYAMYYRWNLGNFPTPDVMYFKLTYEPVGASSRRRTSVGNGIESNLGHLGDKDEFPMASTNEGGCYARGQLSNPGHNQVHGGQSQGFYGSLISPHFFIRVDKPTVANPWNIGPILTAWPTKQMCIDTDLRINHARPVNNKECLKKYPTMTQAQLEVCVYYYGCSPATIGFPYLNTPNPPAWS